MGTRKSEGKTENMVMAKNDVSFFLQKIGWILFSVLFTDWHIFVLCVVW